MKIHLILFFTLPIIAFADSALVQQKLIDIASEEARIANIGSNKSMMLYGEKNALDTINQWNKIQNKPNLSGDQIDQIQHLENIKQKLLKQCQ